MDVKMHEILFTLHEVDPSILLAFCFSAYLTLYFTSYFTPYFTSYFTT